MRKVKTRGRRFFVCIPLDVDIATAAVACAEAAAAVTAAFLQLAAFAGAECSRAADAFTLFVAHPPPPPPVGAAEALARRRNV